MGETISVYVDGRPKLSLDIPGRDFDADLTTMAIGARSGPNGLALPIDGEVDEFVVHSTARSERYIRGRSSPVPLVRFLGATPVLDGPSTRYARYNV